MLHQNYTSRQVLERVTACGFARRLAETPYSLSPSLDKIFAAVWLDNSRLALATKCNQVASTQPAVFLSK